MSESRIIFFHIPKTAGMSLRGLFVKNYRHVAHFNTEMLSFDFPSWEGCLTRLRQIPRAELETYGIFKGHMRFGLHEVLPFPAEYITFLRDPVQRMISYYRMIQRQNAFPEDHVIDPSCKNWNFPDASHSCFFDNGQTRLLSNADPDLPFGACTPDHLQQALFNLEHHFKFVGLTERFDLSLLLLKRLCGWKWHFYVPDNVSVNRPVELSPEVAAAIRELNQFDLELYRYAQERLQKLVDCYGVRLRAEHALFRAGNDLHQRLHFARHRVKRKFGIEKRETRFVNSQSNGFTTSPDKEDGSHRSAFTTSTR